VDPASGVLFVLGLAAALLSWRFRAVWSAVPGARRLGGSALLTLAAWGMGWAESLARGRPEAAILGGVERGLLAASAVLLSGWALRLAPSSADTGTPDA
jgi:hypothetical protein